MTSIAGLKGTSPSGARAALVWRDASLYSGDRPPTRISRREITVRHFSRRYGQSRYGWGRTLSGLFDLITLVMLGRYSHKPLHFFGLLGLACEFLGFYILIILGIGWVQGQWIGNRPIFLVAIFLLLSGLQFIFFGLLAELLIYLSGRREDCSIDEEITGVMTSSDAEVSRNADRPSTTLRAANSSSS